MLDQNGKLHDVLVPHEFVMLNIYGGAQSYIARRAIKKGRTVEICVDIRNVFFGSIVVANADVVIRSILRVLFENQNLDSKQSFTR
jgi:hypothetical protein